MMRTLVLSIIILVVGCKTPDQQIPFLEEDEELILGLINNGSLDLIGFGCTDHWFQKNSEYSVIPFVESHDGLYYHELISTNWLITDIEPNILGVCNRLDRLIKGEYNYTLNRDTFNRESIETQMILEHKNLNYICDIYNSNIEIQLISDSIYLSDVAGYIDKGMEYYFLNGPDQDSAHWSLIIRSDY